MTATLTLREAARYLGIQPRTLRAWIAATKAGTRRTPVPYLQYDVNSPYQFDADALRVFRDAHSAGGTVPAGTVRRRIHAAIDAVAGKREQS